MQPEMYQCKKTGRRARESPPKMHNYDFFRAAVYKWKTYTLTGNKYQRQPRLKAQTHLPFDEYYFTETGVLQSANTKRNM